MAARGNHGSAPLVSLVLGSSSGEAPMSKHGIHVPITKHRFYSTAEKQESLLPALHDEHTYLCMPHARAHVFPSTPTPPSLSAHDSRGESSSKKRF